MNIKHLHIYLPHIRTGARKKRQYPKIKLSPEEILSEKKPKRGQTTKLWRTQSTESSGTHDRGRLTETGPHMSSSGSAATRPPSLCNQVSYLRLDAVGWRRLLVQRRRTRKQGGRKEGRKEGRVTSGEAKSKLCCNGRSFLNSLFIVHSVHKQFQWENAVIFIFIF